MNEPHCAFFLAKDNFAQTKEKYEKTIDEQVRLTCRWGIDNVTENQRVVTAKMWNEPHTVSFCYYTICISQNKLSFRLSKTGRS